jgi:hypothetical protein
MRVLATLIFAAILPAVQTKDTAASRAGFVAGCWIQSGARTVNETWHHVTDDFLGGAGTTVAGGVVTEFEYARIVSKDGVVTYWAQPQGRPPTPFTLDPSSKRDEAIFVNMQHDFPKRVVYRRTAPDALTAFVDGGEGTKKTEFSYKACR